MVEAKVNTVSDQVLLKRYAQSGDQDAFAQLVSRHLELVRGRCKRALSDPGVIDDATQTVFFILARKAQNLIGDGGLAGWLYRVAGYVCADMRKLERRRRFAYARFIDENQSRHYAMAEAEPIMANKKNEQQAVLQVLQGLIDDLPEQSKFLLYEHYIKGRTFSDLTADFCCSEESLRMRARRLRVQLLQSLQRRGVAITALTLLPSLQRLAWDAVDIDNNAASIASQAIASEKLLEPLQREIADRVMQRMNGTRRALAVAILLMGLLALLGLLTYRTPSTVSWFALEKLSAKGDQDDTLHWRLERFETEAATKPYKIAVLSTAGRIQTGDRDEAVLTSRTGDRLRLRSNTRVQLVRCVQESQQSWRLLHGALSFLAVDRLNLETEHGRYLLERSHGHLMLAHDKESFTRVDLRSGSATVKVDTAAAPVKNELFILGADQTLTLGAQITPQITRSDGHEFSPEQSGLFFRTALKSYQARQYLVPSLNNEQWVEVFQKSNSLVVKHDSHCYLSAERELGLGIRIRFRCTPESGIHTEGNFLAGRDDARAERIGLKALFPLKNTYTGPFKQGSMLICTAMLVGRTPQGNPIYEWEEKIDGQTVKRYLSFVGHERDVPCWYQFSGAVTIGELKTERLINSPQVLTINADKDRLLPCRQSTSVK